MSIDPRLIERRKYVAEDNAKRNLGRVLKFLAVVLLAGSLVWLVFSPWLSVSLVETEGIASSSANAILVDAGVIAGTPMIAVNAGAVERALRTDPWIAEARVRRDWPDVVRVEVVERTPAAWVRTDGGWTRRAHDGVSLPSATEPDPAMGWVDMPEVADEEAGHSQDVIGAIEFVGSLPGALRSGTVVTSIDGELWATVAGYQVRLGRPTEMSDKAISLGALLAEDIPEGSTLVLVAPTHPAVMTPRAAAEEQADPSSDDS